MTTEVVSPGVVRGRITAPPSKSYTHRALLAAASRDLTLDIVHPSRSADCRRTRSALRTLGYPIVDRSDGWRIGPRVPPGPRSRFGRIPCGESGTTLRFIAALAARSSRRIRLDGGRVLRTRPISGLAQSLRELGTRVTWGGAPGALPMEVEGPLHPGTVRVPSGETSQFVSGLLLSLSGLPEPSTVRATGPMVSAPYIEATCRVIRHLGGRIERISRGAFRTGGSPVSRAPRRWVIPGDASSAAYLWAAAALTGGAVTTTGIAGDWPQADLAILDLLEKFGAQVLRSARTVRVSGTLENPIDVELTDAPDLVPLVGVLAAAVPGRSVIRGAPQIARKESDRRRGTAQLAHAMGARVRVRRGAIEIEGRRPSRPLKFPAFGDHRLVMSAAVASLVGPGPTRIRGSEAVRKSYPEFWADLRGLGIQIRRSG